MRKGISSVLAVCLTVVIMLGVAAGGWYYFNSKWQSQKKSQQSRITTLQKEISELKKSAAATTVSTTETTTNSSSSNSADSSLSTYTSTKYGYSFKYPKTFSLVDWLWDGQNSVRVPKEGQVVWVSKTALSEKAIPMDADPLSQYFSVSANSELYGLSAIRGDGTGVIISDTTVAGASAWKVIQTVPDDFGGQYSTTYYVNHGTYGYALRIINSNAAGLHDAEEDAMVSSFAFLN